MVENVIHKIENLAFLRLHTKEAHFLVDLSSVEMVDEYVQWIQLISLCVCTHHTNLA